MKKDIVLDIITDHKQKENINKLLLRRCQIIIGTVSKRKNSKRLFLL